MFVLLENFRDNGSNSTRKFGFSLRFEVFEIISLKIGLVSSTMEHDRRKMTPGFKPFTVLRTFLLPSTWLQLPWWKIVRCWFQKRTVLHETKYCFQSSWTFWKFSETLQSCIFKSKLLCGQSLLIKSKGRNIKRRCYCVLQN